MYCIAPTLHKSGPTRLLQACTCVSHAGQGMGASNTPATLRLVHLAEAQVQEGAHTTADAARLRMAHLCICSRGRPSLEWLTQLTMPRRLLSARSTWPWCEAKKQWSQRHGFHANVCHGLHMYWLTECGAPCAERSAWLDGAAFSCVSIKMPLGMVIMDWPARHTRLGICRIHNAHIPRPLSQHLGHAYTIRLALPKTQEGWPLPLARVLSCLPAA